MNNPTSMSSAGSSADQDAAHLDDVRLDQLINRLPAKLQRTVRWLRRPSSRWARIPAGVLLIGGSLLSVLPFFGLWMLPLGIVLLAEDAAPLRRARDCLLDCIERRWPHWLDGRTP